MRKRVSLRWRLALAAWLQAVSVGILLVILFHFHHQRTLSAQLDQTLETKCDEVITVLTRPDAFRAIEQFFLVETEYRHSSDAYFYQINDADGRLLARSRNLGGFLLDSPTDWPDADRESRIHLASARHPLWPEENVRIRSEWVRLAGPGGAVQLLLIQTAASLEALEATVRKALIDDLVVAAGALLAVLLLLWLVTSRALQPVTAMTRKASEITAMSLRDRLPITGAGDEFDELAGVLNGMLDRLETSLRQTEGFSSNASHQLRTRLTRIRGELDLALRSPASEALRSELESIRQDVDDLGRICRRLLLLSRLDQHLDGRSIPGGESIRFDEEIDLGELVSELVEQLTPLARDRKLALRCAGTLHPVIRGNRALLVEALMNLLDNAIKYTWPGGSVDVAIDCGSQEVQASISDDGPGIPADERNRIFERFYQCQRMPENQDGSGLGLAIVRSIARVHGGRVEVADRPAGKPGTVFRLILPVPVR